MALAFVKPEPVRLKGHAEYNEKWVQQRIMDDPTILQLGEVELIAAEKVLPNAGRLDLLLHDDPLERRYEVELMLGATDPSHIMRCIEYWDTERRRFPDYEHIGVLVAEDITTRFLNLISLLAGSIPLIAIQMSALKVDDKILLHFTRVLDQSTLRSDDKYESGDRGGPAVNTDRAWWQARVPATILANCDEILELVKKTSGKPYRHQYLKQLINIVSDDGTDCRVWVRPAKTLVNVGAYVAAPEAWVKRFEEAGFLARLRRGNKAVLVTVTPDALQTHKPLVVDFIGAAFAEEDLEPA